MMEENSPFHLVHSPKVKEFIVRLAATARRLGIVHSVKALLLSVTDKLTNQPIEWGDPLYSSHKPGGTVYRGFLEPFVVRYTIYPNERIVLLWDIRVIPGHPLAK